MNITDDKILKTMDENEADILMLDRYVKLIENLIDSASETDMNRKEIQTKPFGVLRGLVYILRVLIGISLNHYSENVTEYEAEKTAIEILSSK